MKAWDAVPTTTRLASHVRVSGPEETGWFDAQRATHHSPGAGHPVGDCLRQVVEFDGQVVARWVWGPGCYALMGEDRSRSRKPNLLTNPALLALGADPFPNDSLPEIREHLRSKPTHSLDLIVP
jgi:hypothetical protein